MSTQIDRISELARRDRKRKFFSIAHLITPEALYAAFRGLRKKASAGVDGITYQNYEKDAARNIQQLHERLKEGKYRAQPLRRIYIPKENGKERPISIPSLEDKIVQKATGEVLNAIYEQDFLECSYNRKVADLLAVQSDIAREVSQRLRSQLSAEDQQKLTKGSTDNPEAYRLYLKGKYYTNKLTKEGFDTGIDYFSQAIAVDPNYALAYSGLAFNYVNQDDWFMSPNEAGPKTKDAAKRALAIDESDAGAHVSMAIVTHWYDWNWAAAEKEFKRAIELSPNNSDAHTYYSWFLAPMGRNDQSIVEAKRAQQSDPLSGFAAFSVGAALVFARRWDPAIEQLHRAIEIDPNFWFGHCFLGRVYEQKGKLPEAIVEFQRAVELEKDNAETWSGLGHAYSSSGNRAEAQKILDHLKAVSAHSWVAPYNIAVIHTGLGDKDLAFALLDQAYKDRSYYLPTYLATDSRMDSLRSDPRFAELRRRVGLPE
jgi:tetratricopeptide (TPR) repeat protein